MAYKNGKWVEEDAGVADRVAKLSSEDSALMRAASSTGMRQANRRGLQNSSMGIGAGIAEGLKVVTPIASQEASQIHQRNLSAQEYGQQKDIVGTQIAGQKDIAGMEIGSRERMSASEIASRTGLAGMEDKRIRDMTAAELGSRSNLAKMDDTRTRELANAEFESKYGLAAMDDARARDLGFADLAARDRANYAQSASAAAANYQSGIANTLQNDKIPGVTRNAAQSSIGAIYTQQRDMLSQIYGSSNLSWGVTPTPTPAYTPPRVGIGAGVASPGSGSQTLFLG